MAMFCSFPRQPTTTFHVTHIERHPYTSQTFIPTGLSPSEETFYLVISAPTLKGQTINGIIDPPDLSQVEAFVARGDCAVTYEAGTWHSPMVVIGQRRVDFVVYQWMNGVTGDDCELCGVSGEVKVDLESVRGVGRGDRARL
jgi:ureidoglycolate lyase